MDVPPGPRDRLIAGAIDLVRRNGVAGTGITELVAHSKTARRSIYQHFPRGKAQLVEEATRTAGAVLSAAITEIGGDDPVDSLAAFIGLWKDALESSDFTAGCPVVAAALAGVEVPTAPTVAAAVFRDWEVLIAEQLVRAGVVTSTAASLSTFIVGSVEGAVILSISSRSVQPLDQARRHLSELITHHSQRTHR
jgi:TetR/AcrR family transcriptional repressor of lmrAB and yxaGH operons